jgi:hypothetical protein
MCAPADACEVPIFEGARRLGITEVGEAATMKFVATKTAEQLDLQALHRVRARLGSRLLKRLEADMKYQIAPRAFRSGTLDSVINPVNGRLSSKTRKIAEAAENANTARQVKSVPFSGENRL